jgi:hypothetical protein
MAIHCRAAKNSLRGTPILSPTFVLLFQSVLSFLFCLCSLPCSFFCLFFRSFVLFFFPDLLSFSLFWSIVLFFHLVLSFCSFCSFCSFLFSSCYFHPFHPYYFLLLPSRVGFDIPAYHSITVIDLMPARSSAFWEPCSPHTLSSANVWDGNLKKKVSEKSLG